MKICFVLRDYNDCGGIQQATCNLANYLCLKNEKVSIISLYNSNSVPFFKLNSQIENLCLFNSPLNVRKSFFNIKAKLSSFFMNNEFDVIIVQGISYCSLINKRIYNNHRVIVCEHTHFFNGHIFGLHWLGIRTALKRASCIVCLTKIDEKNYKRKNLYNIPIYTIGNFVEEPKNNLGYDLNSKTIISCGSLIPVKGFYDVSLIFKKVLVNHSDWKWIIYGDGEDKNKLETQIREHNLEKNIILAGYEQDKSIIYNNKALYICTSRSEGFGITILEAMSYGIPCLAYNIKYGPQELIENGVNGYLVNPFDIDSMAETIESLITESENRKKLSNNALISYKKYSREEILKKWELLLNGYLAGE